MTLYNFRVPNELLADFRKKLKEEDGLASRQTAVALRKLMKQYIGHEVAEQAALKALKEWCEKNKRDYVKVLDGYQKKWSQ